MVRAVIFFLVYAALGGFAQAQEPAQFFTLDGRLYDSSTPTDPLKDANVTMQIQVLNPAKTCVLYEEEQTVNTLLTEGYFNVRVGSPTVGPDSAKRSSNDVGNSLRVAFQNKNQIINGKTAAGAACTYTPAAGDERHFRFIVTPATTGVTATLSPDMTIDSVPQAVIAETVQGLGPQDFIQVNANVTQVKADSLFGASYTALSDLIAGTSTSYLQNNPNGTVIPVRVADPGGPSEGQLWFDSMTNQVKYYDGTAVQALGTSGGDPTKLPLAGGTMLGNINMGGQQILATGHVTMSPLSTITVGKYDNVDQATLIGGMNASNKGAVWYNSNTNKLMHWDGAAAKTVNDMTVGTGAGQLFTIDQVPNCSASQKLQMSAGPMYSWSCVNEGTKTAIADADSDTKIQVEETADEDKIRFDTAGSERMIVDSTGNVGIGTATPGYPLEVAKNADTTVLASVSNPNSGASSSAGLRFESDGGASMIVRTSVGNTTGFPANATLFYGPGASNFVFYGSAPLMTLTAAGKLGLGTQGPTGKLSVVDSTASSTLAALSNLTDGAAFNISTNTATGSQVLLQSGVADDLGFAVNGSATPNLFLDSANVGIGTLTPGEKLDVNGKVKGTELCIGADCRAAWPVPGTGDITDVTTSGTSGLSGGVASGNANISVNVDNSTIEINANNLRVKDAGITDAKIVGMSVDKITSAATKYFTYMPNNSQCGSNEVLKWDDTNDRWICGADNNTDAVASVFGRTGIVAATAGDYTAAQVTNVAAGSIAAVTVQNALNELDTEKVAKTDVPQCTAGQKLQMGAGPMYTWSCVADLTGATSMVDADNDTKIQVEEAADEDIIRFDTAGTERMIIDNSGRVGIGTVTASQKLHVNGGNILLSGAGGSFLNEAIDNSGYPVFIGRRSRSGPTAPISGDILSSFVGGPYGQANMAGMDIIATETHWPFAGSAILFKTIPNGSGASAERLRIDNNGNVGIGLSNPGEKLEVSGKVKATELCIGADCRAAWPAGGTGDINDGGNNTGSPILIGNNANQSLLFETNNSIRMTITAAGLTGLGYTSPGSMLSVNGGAR